MSTTDYRTDPDTVAHIVSRWEHLIGGVLRLRVPRARCGAPLELTADNPVGPAPESPTCPACQARATAPSAASNWVSAR